MRVSSTALVVVLISLVIGCNTATPTRPSSTAAIPAGSATTVRPSSTGSARGGLLDIGTAAAQAGGATVLQLQVPCHFYNGDGLWSLAIGDCTFHLVFLPSGEAAEVIASGEITPASDGQSAHFDINNIPLPCTIDVPGFVTDDWEETVSASGHVTFHCKFR